MEKRQSLNRSSIISLQSSSLLSQENQEAVNELAEQLQAEGFKAASKGKLDKITELVEALKSNNCEFLINLVAETDGHNMLHRAISHQHLDIVKYLIEQGANCEYTTKDEDDYTPLMLAIECHNHKTQAKSQHLISTLSRKKTNYSNEILILLINAVDINTANASGTTPLSLAVQLQNEDIVQRLLDNPDINVEKEDNHGYTALHYACDKDNKEIITLLLDKKADMFHHNKKGYLPIHITCLMGNAEVLDHLLQKCPEIRERLLRETDSVGNTPLLLAKEAPITDAFTLLQTKYESELDVEAKAKNGDCILHKYAKEDDGMLNEGLLEEAKYKSMMDEVNSNRETPLHVACQRGHLRSVVLLIEKDADYKVKDAIGYSPVMTAIAANNLEVLLHMLKAILNREADHSLKTILSLNAKSNKTIMVWAVESNHTSLIEAIIQLDLNLATESDPDTNRTLLHIAAAAGAIESIKALLSNKHVCGLLQQCDGEGKTPLMLAAQYGYTECVKICHAPDEINNQVTCHSSDLNATDKDGHTALHLACLNGHLPVVKHLCAINADLEACEEGSIGTPLACAASTGHEEIVSYLLGQDVQVNGKNKKAPLILASKNGHDKCVQQLLQHSAINVSIQDKDGYNCLAVAAKNRELQVALIIVNSRHWKKALKGCDNNDATPFRLLIQYLPDAAEVVLYRCIEEKKNNQAKVVEIEMSFEFLDDFQDLVTGKSQLHGLFNTLQGGGGGNDEHGFMELQAQNTLSKDESENSGSDNSTVNLPSKFNKQNHVLHWMVKYERIKLLQHPVTQALISYKWKAYAMPYSIIILALYLVFLAFLTAFSTVMPFPIGKECASINGTVNCEGSSGEQVFLRFTAVILLIFCGIRTAMELLEFVQRRLQYLWEIDNYLEILLIVSTAIFAIAGHAEDCFCVSSFSWQFGAVALFLGWIDLIVYLKKLPLTGIRINMLQTVVITFLKLIYLPAILIIAFALPFYMLFSRQEVENSFHTPAFSLMKSLVMTSGEMEYEQVFRFRDNQDDEPPGALHFIVMSNILWVIFIVMMPILFINLLIGLAVDDTQKIEEKATLNYLSLKVDSALEIEEKLPIRVRRMFKLHSIAVKKGSEVPWHLKWYYKLHDGLRKSTTFKVMEKEFNQLKEDEKLSSMLQGKEVLEPIDEIKAQVSENTDAVSQLQATLDEIKEESKQTAVEIGEILCILKDMKQDTKGKNSSTVTRSTIHGIKKFIGKSKSTLRNL